MRLIILASFEILISFGFGEAFQNPNSFAKHVNKIEDRILKDFESFLREGYVSGLDRQSEGVSVNIPAIFGLTLGGTLLTELIGFLTATTITTTTTTTATDTAGRFIYSIIIFSQNKKTRRLLKMSSKVLVAA